MKKTIGNIIASFRKEYNLTQIELAEKIGLSRVIITKIETGQRAVSLDEAKSFSSVFGMDFNSFLEFTNHQENRDERPFVKAFKAKNLDDIDLDEILKIEHLVDALNVQELIHTN